MYMITCLIDFIGRAKFCTEYQRKEAASKYKEQKILCNKIFKREHFIIYLFLRREKEIYTIALILVTEKS